MANNVKDDTAKIATQNVIDVLAWHLKVHRGTMFRHKVTGESIIVVNPDFTGSSCKNSQGDIKYYGFKELVEKWEMVKTDMAQVLYEDERT